MLDLPPSTPVNYSGIRLSMDTSSNNQIPKDPTKLQESGKEFEAILWRQILEPALSPVLAQKNDASSDIQRSFMVQALADNFSKSIDLGFSSMLQMQAHHSNPFPENSIKEK